MKTATLAIAVLSLLSFTTAQPHGRRHGAFRHVLQRKSTENIEDVNVVKRTTLVKAVQALRDDEVLKEKRQMVTATIDGHVVSWMNDWFGKPAKSTRTTTVQVAENTKPAAKVAAIPTSAPQKEKAPASAAIKEQSKSSNSGGSSAGNDAADKTTADNTAAGKGFGFSYTPFKADESCKNAAEVKSDFAAIGKEYSLVRIYGTSCNQVETVLAAAKEHNLRIFAGIFDISQVVEEANLIINAAKNDWARFDTISVGNEVVNAAPEDQKAATASAVIGAIGTAKKLLKGAGFNGKIVAVDTLVAARAYPQICAASDFCAVNCHPFFDGQVEAGDSGKFVQEQVATLAKVISPGQDIVVTETGWPWKGNTNKAAVPSLDNQGRALSSIKSAFKSNKSGVILFTLYNDHWKKSNSAQFEAEQFWGFNGQDAPSG